MAQPLLTMTHRDVDNVSKLYLFSLADEIWRSEWVGLPVKIDEAAPEGLPLSSVFSLWLTFPDTFRPLSCLESLPCPLSPVVSLSRAVLVRPRNYHSSIKVISLLPQIPTEMPTLTVLSGWTEYAHSGPALLKVPGQRLYCVCNFDHQQLVLNGDRFAHE